MALLDVADVVQAVATLMDDPGQTSIDIDYVLPFLNLKFNDVSMKLAMLGLQYGEEEACFTIPAGTENLSNFMLQGQPLASLMVPISIDWKEVGEADEEYTPVDSVRELDDLPTAAGGSATTGIAEYSWQGGTILITPPGSDVTGRVRFKSLSATEVDAVDNLIRGAGNVIAYFTTALIYAIRGNPLKVDMKAQGDEALDDFLAMSNMRDQTTFYQIQPTHKRRYGPVGIAMAPSIPTT
jgi:hypothetical protein